MSRDVKSHENTVLVNFIGHLSEEHFRHLWFTNTDPLTMQLNDYIRRHSNDRISTRVEVPGPVQDRARTFAPWAQFNFRKPVQVRTGARSLLLSCLAI